jgi:hypothetical protein
LAVCQNTAHAVVPVHTKPEFELFRQLIESQGFYYSLSKQPAVASASKAIDFTRLAQAWTAKVHELVLDNGEHERKLFYKLPEQLERHYKKWLQAVVNELTLWNHYTYAITQYISFEQTQIAMPMVSPPVLYYTQDIQRLHL